MDLWVRRLVQTLPLVLTAGLVFLLCTASSLPVSNPDTFFHLRFGDEFLHGWSIWHPGSVTRYATASWVPTQWLGEVGLAAVANAFGLPGVAWVTGAAFLAYTTAILVSCRQVAGAWPAVGATILAVLGSSEGVSARPQVLSYLLVVVTAEAWRRTSQDGRPRWWLLAVAWIWPLLHGMWPLGIAVSAAAAVGIVADRHRTLPAAEVRRLLALPVLMAVLSALTPIGPRIYPAVLLVGARGRYYTEWASPDFHKLPAICVLLLLATVVVLRMRAGSRSWYGLLTLGAAALFAVYSTRTVPLAAGLLAPMAAAAVGDLIGRDDATRRRDVRVGIVVVVLGLVGLAIAVPHTAARADPVPSALPRPIARELAALPAGTGVLNLDYTGGYLMWRYPDLQFFANGYGDTFTDAELDHNKQIIQLQPGWPQVLARTGLRRALLDPDGALAYALVHQRGWRIVHQGSGWAWLEAP